MTALPVGVWSTVGTGRYAPLETDVVLVPKAHARDGSVPGVVYCHVSGGSALAASDPYDRPGEWCLVRSIAEHHPVVVADLGGPSTFGNPASQARIDDARRYLQDQWGARPGPVHLVGVSMGVLGALQYAASHRDRVSALVAVLPLIDLAAIYHANPSGISTLIASAWGILPGAPLPPMANPMDRVGELTGLPCQGWYSGDDTTSPADTTLRFFGLLGCADDAHDVGALGHTQGAIGAASPAAVLGFLAAHPDVAPPALELPLAS